jgi:hypothetical protein
MLSSGETTHASAQQGPCESSGRRSQRDSKMSIFQKEKKKLDFIGLNKFSIIIEPKKRKFNEQQCFFFKLIISVRGCHCY